MRRVVAAALLLSVFAGPSAVADPYGRILAPFVDGGSVQLANGVLVLSANGHALTGGWSSVVVVIPPSQQGVNGLYSVTVEGFAPKGPATQAITPFQTNPLGWPNYPSDLKQVRFVSAGNMIVVKLGSSSGGGTTGKTH